MVSAHSHEEASLPLNPDQFMETCVTVDMKRWAGRVNPGTCSTLCIPVTLLINRNTSKNANILPGVGYGCVFNVKKSYSQTLDTNVTSRTFVTPSFSR